MLVNIIFIFSKNTYNEKLIKRLVHITNPFYFIQALVSIAE